jgi:hypothetical protein
LEAAQPIDAGRPNEQNEVINFTQTLPEGLIMRDR